MLTLQELIHARSILLERTLAFFTDQPDVLGTFLAGSIPEGTADAYSDIDLRVVATPEGQMRLLGGMFEWPAQWGDLLFNEWVSGTECCVSHFRPFLKIDVFYLSPATFSPSPWLNRAIQIRLDRTGLIGKVIEESQSLSFLPPKGAEVSRILSKTLACAHEVVRRVRRGELFYAQTLLEQFRAYTIRLDAWLHGIEPSVPRDLKLAGRLSPALAQALERSYVSLSADDIDGAVVDMSNILVEQIPELHKAFDLKRSLSTDLYALNLVRMRQVA